MKKLILLILFVLLYLLVISCKAPEIELNPGYLDGAWITKELRVDGKSEKCSETTYVLLFNRDSLRTNIIHKGKRLSGKYVVDERSIVILNKGKVFTIGKIKEDQMEIVVDQNTSAIMIRLEEF